MACWRYWKNFVREGRYGISHAPEPLMGRARGGLEIDVRMIKDRVRVQPL